MTKEKSKKAVKKKETSKSSTKKTELQPRIHFNEYIHSEHPSIDNMEMAGFKTFAGEALWKRPNEWEQCFNQYKNRNK